VAPEAQCLGPTVARFALACGPEPQIEAWDSELGLRAVPAGPDPILDPGTSLLTLEGSGIVLSALKPAEQGTGLVVRVLNPTGDPVWASLRWNLPMGGAVLVRLDEEVVHSGQESAEALDGEVVRFEVPPHALRSIRVEPS
jgi:alpha-mannosidase